MVNLRAIHTNQVRKNNMKKKILISCSVLLFLGVFDRLFFIENRLHGVWEFNSGSYFGDPIAYNQDFVLNKSKIKFVRNKSEDNPVLDKEVYLVGCYFNILLMYDNNLNKTAFYIKL